MGALLQSVDTTIEEIMNLHRCLPPRPSIEEVEAAMAVIRSVDKDKESRLEAISRQKKSPEIPEELFFVLQEMQRGLIQFQSKEQKREALKLLDLENTHQAFDEWIQRASGCVPSSSDAGGVNMERKVERSSSARIARDDNFVKKAKSSMYVDDVPDLGFAPRGMLTSSMISQPTTSGDRGVYKQNLWHDSVGSALSKPATSGEDSDKKLSLIRLAALIEVSSKKGTQHLDLQNKLADQVDWLPDSLGKLSTLLSLDLSENRIVALPLSICNLTSLTKLDLHSNRIAELPDAIGDLINLLYLDVRANDLTSLPSTFGKLARLLELDLGSNRLSVLPESIGNLINLKKLSVETNDIEELPYTIGNCVNLVELRADYNRLKCLPEAVGKLEMLEVLTARYNNISKLPTTMSSLSNLREMDVSFNELESVPESLCLATTLVKLNIGNNFANLRALPRSIGNLEMLEELDMSNNQIRILPDSFAMLSKLRVLRAEENPLEVPPRHIAEKGAEAVVQYMVELIQKRDVKLPATKTKSSSSSSSWSECCFFSRSNKRKTDGWDYVN